MATCSQFTPAAAAVPSFSVSPGWVRRLTASSAVEQMHDAPGPVRSLVMDEHFTVVNSPSTFRDGNDWWMAHHSYLRSRNFGSELSIRRLDGISEGWRRVVG